MVARPFRLFFVLRLKLQFVVINHITCSNQLRSHFPFCNLFSCPILLPSYLLLPPSISLAHLPFHLICSSNLPSHLLPSPTISLALPPFFPISQSNRTFCDFRSVQRLSGCLNACTLCVLFVRTCDFCGGALSHFLRHRLNDPTVRFSTNFVFPLIGPFEGPLAN